VFASHMADAWPYRYAGELHIWTINGGTPSDPDVARKWIETHISDPDDMIREAVAKTMAERGITKDEAADEVNELRHLNGFKRDDATGLYIDGRQLKACLKEAASIAANAGKITAKGWGNPDDRNYLKGIKAWFPEHVVVTEDRLPLGTEQPSGVVQRFIHSRHGAAIQYEEYVTDAKVAFHVNTDYLFTDKQWAVIWLTAEQQGIGASRSQGYGRFEVTRWDALHDVAPARRPRKRTGNA
jgi:hypothetical protein